MNYVCMTKKKNKLIKNKISSKRFGLMTFISQIHACIF